MMLEINDLPGEMLMEIHKRLPPSGLKMAVLVNKLWRDLCEEASLWTWCKFTIYTRKDFTCLSIRRLQRIQEISINPAILDADDWEALFLVLMKLPYLKRIDGLGRAGYLYIERHSVEPGLFARSLAKLVEIDLLGSTIDQIHALFTEMSRSTRLKKLHLSSHDLRLLDPRLFARVLSRLEDLLLADNRAADDQIEALFIEILNTNCMKRLQLKGVSVVHLEPKLFARALSKVEDITLEHHFATDDQMRELFKELSLGTQMKKLNLRDVPWNLNGLNEVEPRQFARALSRLEDVILNLRLRLTNGHLQALFTEMSRHTRLKKLDLGRRNPELFAKGLSTLEDVYLYSGITTVQMRAFFYESSRNPHLKTLHISSVNLSSLNPDVLSTAVTRLEAVTLKRARISTRQAAALFTKMSRNDQLKKIDLSGNDLSSADPQVFAIALNGLEEVSLCNTGITHDQARALFTTMSRNTKIKKLKLSDDLSTVDPEVLATALTKLKEVTVCGPHLSTEQICSIFKRVLLADKKLIKLDLSDNDGAAVNVDPDLVRKVTEKLKGELEFMDELEELESMGVSSSTESE